MKRQPNLFLHSRLRLTADQTVSCAWLYRYIILRTRTNVHNTHARDVHTHVQWRIQDSRRGRQPSGVGARDTIFINFPENCMKSKTIWSLKRGRLPGGPPSLDPPMHMYAHTHTHTHVADTGPDVHHQVPATRHASLNTCHDKCISVTPGPAPLPSPPVPTPVPPLPILPSLPPPVPPDTHRWLRQNQQVGTTAARKQERHCS